MEANSSSNSTRNASSLRWKILKRAILGRPSSNSDNKSEVDIQRISRKATRSFNLIPCRVMKDSPEGKLDSLSEKNQLQSSRDAVFCYTLPVANAPQLLLHQRVDDLANLSDFEVCNKYDIDNTGLVCQWPSEEVLAYYCLSHPDMFRQKRVIELGSGYGLAGLAVAMTTEALEVIISDGNPQVIGLSTDIGVVPLIFPGDHPYMRTEEQAKRLVIANHFLNISRHTIWLTKYTSRVESLSVIRDIQHNINANFGGFGSTEVKSLMLHWGQDRDTNISNKFDIIIGSDCTFFKEFHQELVQTIKLLLKREVSSEAILFSPKRGDSLDKFLLKVKDSGLRFSVDEIYHTEVWKCHQGFVNGDDSWPNYEMDHCYPLLVRITW